MALGSEKLDTVGSSWPSKGVDIAPQQPSVSRIGAKSQGDQ